jgi:DNA-binding beta-propeller fold protein YncE
VFYNKDNPDGSVPNKYKVTGSASGGESGPLSNAITVAGKKVYVDSISISVALSVIDPVLAFSGAASATFTFPARHFGLLLNGHATLAEADVLTQTVVFSGVIAAVPTVLPYEVTGEITDVGQAVLRDWSEV